MRPVFIGGCARSGTTMLGSMLGAHSTCLVLPESQFILDLLRSPLAEPFDAEAVGARLVEHFRFKTWGVDIRPPEGAEAVAIASYRELIEWFVARYGALVERPERERWIEHSPWNTQFAPTLFDLFPEARLIHLVRDGRAVAASIMRVEWGPNEIHFAAPWWAHRLAFGLAAESHYGPERARRVRYEDLVLDPEGTLRDLCEFLGLEFEPAMLAADGLRVPDYTSGWHKLVGSKPDPARLEAWRRDLTPRQIEIFESITGELSTYLGYPLDYGLTARPITRREKILPFLRDHLFRRRANRLRFKRAEKRVVDSHSEPTGDAQGPDSSA